MLALLSQYTWHQPHFKSIVLWTWPVETNGKDIGRKTERLIKQGSASDSEVGRRESVVNKTVRWLTGTPGGPCFPKDPVSPFGPGSPWKKKFIIVFCWENFLWEAWLCFWYAACMIGIWQALTYQSYSRLRICRSYKQCMYLTVFASLCTSRLMMSEVACLLTAGLSCGMFRFVPFLT